MTQIGALPVSAGRGVLHNVAGVFKRGDRDHEHHPADTAISGQASQPVGLSDTLEAKSAFPPSPVENHASTTDPGSLRVTVLGAKDLSTSDSKSYVTIRVGDKEFKTKHTSKTATPEWLVFVPRFLIYNQYYSPFVPSRNESFLFAASTLTPKLFAWVHDHKTIGKDKDLGEGEVDVRLYAPFSDIHGLFSLLDLAPHSTPRSFLC